MENVKVTVTIDLEIPIGNDSLPFLKDNPIGYVSELVFNNITNYTANKHLIDATRWLSESKGNIHSSAYTIYQYHDTWADIINKAKTVITIIQ